MRILLLLALLSTTACGNLRRAWSGITGDAQAFCYKGVEYVQMPSGASVAYDQNGKVLTCK